MKIYIKSQIFKTFHRWSAYIVDKRGNIKSVDDHMHGIIELYGLRDDITQLYEEEFGEKIDWYENVDFVAEYVDEFTADENIFCVVVDIFNKRVYVRPNKNSLEDPSPLQMKSLSDWAIEHGWDEDIEIDWVLASRKTKIYRISQSNDIPEFLDQFEPLELKGLAAEALKCNSFEEFKQNFLREIKHGSYWHITDDPNFRIDPEKGPRDMSSIGRGQTNTGKLMVTSHLDYWLEYYTNRDYVAEIDMSMVDPQDYYQVNRGFGNEFFVVNPEKARVVRVMSREEAEELSEQKRDLLPQNGHALQSFYNDVWNQYKEFEKL